MYRSLKKEISNSIILKISAIISGLISIPRILTLFDITEKITDSYTDVNINDIIVRFISLFLLCILSFYLNTRWKIIYSHYSISYRNGITFLLNSFLLLAMVQLFVISYNNIVGQKLTESEIGLTYFVYFVILIITFFISRVLRYQIIHQQDLLEKQQLKQQSLESELSALKNQINPHFLFNSLNTLKSIVQENEQADTFINKLSYMYRYILQSGISDLVTIEEELKFLNSYIHLLQTRYRNRLEIYINIEDNYLNKKIPPLSIQLLVENAVKHNEISEQHPLHIYVFSKEEKIQVENKIRPRKELVESTGNGLININKRFQLLKNKSISIQSKDEMFSVKLPIN